MKSLKKVGGREVNLDLDKSNILSKIVELSQGNLSGCVLGCLCVSMGGVELELSSGFGKLARQVIYICSGSDSD